MALLSTSSAVPARMSMTRVTAAAALVALAAGEATGCVLSSDTPRSRMPPASVVSGSSLLTPSACRDKTITSRIFDRVGSYVAMCLCVLLRDKPATGTAAGPRANSWKLSSSGEIATEATAVLGEPRASSRQRLRTGSSVLSEYEQQETPHAINFRW